MNDRHRASGVRRQESLLSVPLLRRYGDSYQLDKLAVEHVFCRSETRDLPVVIISMAGVMHCGKSLMLNYFYDYFHRLRHPSNASLSIPPKECFTWGNGIVTQPKTIGIYVSRKPVIVKRGNEEVGVYFMDTEGLSRRQCHHQQLVFSLSTLLSSVQIINVSKNIQDQDLIPLYSFTSAAHELSKYSSDVPFQSSIVFLVRDFADLKYRLGEEGGEMYLSTILGPGAHSRRDYYYKLEDAFQDVRCFLMPHPGSKATVQQVKHNFRGSQRELNHTFVENLQGIIRMLLTAEQLEPKQINGKVVTGSDFRDYIETCLEVVDRQSGLLNSSSLVKLVAHTKFELLVTDHAKKFKESMESECENNVLEESELIALYERAREISLGAFDNSLSWGNAGVKDRHRVDLERIIEGIFDKIRKENSLTQDRAAKKHESLLQKCIQLYKKDFEDQANAESVDVSSITTAHEIAIQNAMGLFDRHTERMKNLGGAKFIQKYRDRLQKTADDVLNSKLIPLEEANANASEGEMLTHSTIGVRGGELFNEVCTLMFHKGAFAADTEVRTKITSFDENWPSNGYVRNSPIIQFEPNNKVLRKPAICRASCWYISFSPCARATENIYVMQKKGNKWVEIHSEAMERKTHIEFHLKELSAIALCTARSQRIGTFLFVDRNGNFLSKFFDIADMEAVREASRKERYSLMSDLNTLDLNSFDRVEVTLQAQSYTIEPNFHSFSGQDICSSHAARTFQFMTSVEESDYGSLQSVMKYTIKVNDSVKLQHPFRVDLQNPGRPNTALRDPVIVNQNNRQGEYLAISEG